MHAIYSKFCCNTVNDAMYCVIFRHCIHARPCVCMYVSRGLTWQWRHTPGCTYWLISVDLGLRMFAGAIAKCANYCEFY